MVNIPKALFQYHYIVEMVFLKRQSFLQLMKNGSSSNVWRDFFCVCVILASDIVSYKI